MRTSNKKPTGITLTNELQIVGYLHCCLCAQQKPDNTSPSEWASLEVGWTKQGLQVWCKRHQCNVIHIDFEGQKHHANTSRPA